MKTGVCYYPEHWPEDRWAIDASHMRKIGISVVRIGEFAWSRLEDKHGNLTFDWLERAIDVLHAEGLSVVLGTPTATPPRWMLDKHPDMLAVDINGRIRDFGSRRHYCFSHAPYLSECKRIVTELAQRFGQHPAIIAWQTDNEYGCHETSISYSAHALAAFQQWCEEQYQNIDQLNTDWGNVFWSMEYDDFSQIGLPVGTVTESNPAHQLAFWRFSSDQIRGFNKTQVDVLRRLSPGKDVLHNFMGNFVEFDHHLVSKDLDIATWDNYPLGFLTRDNSRLLDQTRFSRTGHPDGSAFHHDLYRSCCQGRWWVMEQQPGPVNWAPYNPSPVDGMVRLWGWEAFAHGAEVMSYFRWRQAPFAQEQTHAGLLLPDASEDTAAKEVSQLNAELTTLEAYASDNNLPFANPDKRAGELMDKADVAIIFSYSGIAIQDIQPPGGQSFSALDFCQQIYGACRQLGADIDILSSDASFSGYKLIVLCTSTEDDPALVDKLRAVAENEQTVVVLFPGTGSRTHQYAMPDNLAPGAFQDLINVRVVRSESLPVHEKVIARSDAGDPPVCCASWREKIESDLAPAAYFEDQWGFHFRQDNVHYINSAPELENLVALMEKLLAEASVSTRDLGPYLRTRRMGPWRLAFNYGPNPVHLASSLGDQFDFSSDTTVIIGSNTLNQGEIAVWAVE